MSHAVFRCPTHTTWIKTRRDGVEYDENVRTAACTEACKIMEDLRVKGMPLTEFLKRLMTYANDDLLKASAKKAAKHYGIKLEHAEGYLRMEREARGLKA